MKNLNKIDSLVSFTETDLRVDSHYRSENFTRSNLGYQRQGNENLISLASGIKNMKFSNKSSIIGKNTNQALMSGFNVGYKIMIESYIKLIKTTYKRNFNLGQKYE